MKKNLLLIILITIVGISTTAQNRDIRMYCFGHSLIDHRPPAIPTPGDETTILHWMNEIALEAGHTFATGGQYGFLNNHSNLPPNANWGYDQIPWVWNQEEGESFGDAINTILLTAANFIQYQPSNAPYPLDESTTVINLTETIFDWVNEENVNIKYYIYANWPEMDLASPFPGTLPLQSEIDGFHNYTIGPFTEWWKTYQDQILVSRPSINTRLIPVGQIISKIWRDLLPNTLPFDELYEDSDPHGRANTYFLAGMITYMAIYQENIPTTYLPDDIIHQTIREELPAIRDFIWTELNNFNLPNGDSRVFDDSFNAINEKSKPLTIGTYPNPTKGKFEILGDINNINIEIMDSKGNVSLPLFSNSTSIDISSLADGIYFVKIYNLETHENLIKRIIKINK